MNFLLEYTDKGIYCPQANVYIDPKRRVDNAIITHAHGDHARSGCTHYIAHKHSECILRMRLSESISLRTVEYGETFFVNGVKFSLHPAGHIIGSAQIRVEYKGQVWVVSGDYKLQNDNFSAPFEAVKCNVFITESTFGVPFFKWEPQKLIFDDMRNWIAENKRAGKTSVLMGYSLGKMQRLLVNLQPFNQPIYAHADIQKLHERLREAGFNLPKTIQLKNNFEREELRGAVVLAPPVSDKSGLLKKFIAPSTGYCSGWLAMKNKSFWRSFNKGFVLSDHADWNELNTAVKETGAEKVFVTHGYQQEFADWLNKNKIEAAEIEMMHPNATPIERKKKQLEIEF